MTTDAVFRRKVIKGARVSREEVASPSLAATSSVLYILSVVVWSEGGVRRREQKEDC